ncbi:MAG: hypothetical protein L7G98_02995 [Vulcanisaeta sp.]|nr:hypothetical protein [Vulcanisaeta sp.]
MDLRRLLIIYAVFWVGIFIGALLDLFLGFGFVSVRHVRTMPPIPDFRLFLGVIIVNFATSIIIFVLGVLSSVVQLVAILAVSAYVGELAFRAGLVVGLVGIAPHAPLEFLGFSFIAYAGQCRGHGLPYARYLALGYVLLLVAAVVESTLSIYVLRLYLTSTLNH